MNCEHAQHAVLLANSGELSDKQKAGLDAHLAGCAACRSYRDDLARMLSATRDTPLENQLSELTLVRINQAATRGLNSAESPGEKGGVLLQLWRPALAMGAAAALVILLAVPHFREDTGTVVQAPEPTGTNNASELLTWNPSFDEAFETLDRLLVMSVDDADIQENGESLDRLAEELIELESWNI